jgi:nucleotide-binding universal stress UspA family protein
MSIQMRDSERAGLDPGRIHRIVVGVDLTDGSSEAIAVAAMLARAVGADLSLLHVAPDPFDQPWAKTVDVELGDLAERWVVEAETRLRHLQTGLEPGRVTTVVRLGSAADEILRFAVETDADVIVMGRHSAREVASGRTGRVVSRVLECARCPVITAPVLESERVLIPSPAPLPSSGAERAIHGILVATDLSTLSRAAVAFARRLGTDLHCPVHVLHVVESPWTRSPAYATPEPETIETLRRAARAFHTRALQAWYADGAGVHLHPLVRVGDPATEIVRCAAQMGADLIVLGTHGRGAVGRRLLGSVARDVVTRAACPIVTIGRLSARRARRHTAPAASGPNMSVVVPIAATGQPRPDETLEAPRAVPFHAGAA